MAKKTVKQICEAARAKLAEDMKPTKVERAGDSRSEWYGDSTNGIEIRYHGDELDEIVLHINGKCVFHMECMSDVCYWMGLYAGKHTVHANVFSKNLRSHVMANAEGWTEK